MIQNSCLLYEQNLTYMLFNFLMALFIDSFTYSTVIDYLKYACKCARCLKGNIPRNDKVAVLPKFIIASSTYQLSIQPYSYEVRTSGCLGLIKGDGMVK